jgi:hypothetical protein
MDDGPSFAIFLTRMRRLIIKGAVLVLVLIGAITFLYLSTRSALPKSEDLAMRSKLLSCESDAIYHFMKCPGWGE